MSKKSRRERTPNLPPDAFNVPAAPAIAPVAAAPAADVAPAKAASNLAAPGGRKPAASGPASASVDWKGEYGEVIGDLRRTFLIFAGLIVAMIALTFVIR